MLYSVYLAYAFGCKHAEVSLKMNVRHGTSPFGGAGGGFLPTLPLS